MDRETLIYIGAILDNCGKLRLIKDKRTGTIYPYLRLKIKDKHIKMLLREELGGTISGDFFILSHRKAKEFLDIVKDYTLHLKQKIDLVNQLYSISLSKSYRKEYRENIYKQFMRLEDGARKRV